MKIDKSNLKHGIWYEDKDGNYIPSTDSADAPEEAVTCHVCFPLQIRTEHYNIKPHIDSDGNVRRTYHGSDRFLTTSCHIGGGNEPVILAMVNSGDFTLSEALAVYANACERCANVLAYKYLNGADGYPEYSEEWKKCGTVCEYCAGEGYSDRVRGHRIENPLTDSPLVLPGEIITTSEMEAIIKPIEEEEKSSTCCETCKNYESTSDITGWCSACPGTVIKGMNANNTCAKYEKRRKGNDSRRRN